MFGILFIRFLRMHLSVFVFVECPCDVTLGVLFARWSFLIAHHPFVYALLPSSCPHAPVLSHYHPRCSPECHADDRLVSTTLRLRSQTC